MVDRVRPNGNAPERKTAYRLQAGTDGAQQQATPAEEAGGIWCYGRDGWSRRADPVAWPEHACPDSRQVDELREQAGFHRLDEFGTGGSRFQFTLYGHEDRERWLVGLRIGDDCHTLLVETLPALLDLVAKVLPLLQAGLAVEAEEEQEAARLRELRRKCAAKGGRR